MGVGGPRGRIRHRRGRGSLSIRSCSHPVAHPGLPCASSVFHSVTSQPAHRPRRERTSCHPWLLCTPVAASTTRPHRQTSERREARPPARRPRRELRSARRLEARPGPAGLAPPTSRAATHPWPCRHPPAPQPPPARRTDAHPIGQQWGFCSIRNSLPACRRRVGVLMVPFPHGMSAGRDRQRSRSSGQPRKPRFPT
ncbi:Uncharacterised protein [Schaalia odontolytica]|uniref:Uncharacterized protein n=1 Tax=Schaalia odontolytica TaxID=1660 RepID=A0A2X0TYK8_9ACTO|nr:Uncharacterised protein [Schaalia odontolytica]